MSDTIWDALDLGLNECGGPVEVRKAMVLRAYELEPDSEVSYDRLPPDEFYGVNFARHNYDKADALCLSCQGDERPHLSCYGWLCCCECNGEEV